MLPDPPALSGQASFWLVEINNVSFTSPAVFSGMSAGSFSETAAGNRAYSGVSFVKKQITSNEEGKFAQKAQDSLIKSLAKFLWLFSFIMESRDSSYHVQNIPIVNIKEGETAHDVRRTGIPRSTIIRMDQLEPVYL